MMNIKSKDVIKYAVLPGIRPRLQDLITSGFQHIPFFMALVYQAVRLLPNNHPYANARNIGRFGIRHVIAEAANNLVISSKNIDQILLFFTILFGLGLIFVQLGLLGMSIFIQPVMAAVDMPTNFAGFFITPAEYAAQDLAYIFMDLVFGVPDIFNSCVALVDTDCVLNIAVEGGTPQRSGESLVDPWTGSGMSWPFPIHHALHQMFSLYSIGLLSVAVFITVYFIIVIVVETAQTGTAFGKRFNKVWAPIRIVVAFGLLIPVGHGLNSSQYIVLYAAKFGSGFASNGWAIFNQELTGTYLGQKDKLVTRPNVPDVTELLQFMYTAAVCYEMEYIKNAGQKEIIPYLIGDPFTTPLNLNEISFLPPNERYDQMLDFATTRSGGRAVRFSSKLSLRFGYLDEDENSGNRGAVKPVCGEITINLFDTREEETDREPAADMAQRYYWFVISELWYDVFTGMFPGDYSISQYTQNYPLNLVCEKAPYADDTPDCPPNISFELPDSQYRADVQQFYTDDLNALLDDPGLTGLAGIVNSSVGMLRAQINSDEWLGSSEAMQEKGWAGAGLWYNKVAELNGTISAAISDPPSVSLWPEIMERTMQDNIKNAEFIDLKNRFNPAYKGFSHLYDREGYILWEAFDYWQSGAGATPATNNVLVDTIKALLGTEGLFSMRKNPDVHPLALLVGVGRSLINSAIGNLADSAALSLISAGIGGSQGITAITGFIMTIVIISLTAGFILFYVLPFLPFIYFFFAVGGWIKGIFEAMVGAPLWALAHIRIDGDGLSGKAALNGYFLIFEIFLRPILIVFGMLASISIFSALVSVMNQTWGLVTTNLAGFDPTTGGQGAIAEGVEMMRGEIDAFFFTVIYTIIVYLMAMSSFKLIDLIPNNILRWMGQAITTFNDEAENPAEGLTGKAAIGAQQSISTIGGGAQKTLQGISSGSPKKPGG